MARATQSGSRGGNPRAIDAQPLWPAARDAIGSARLKGPVRHPLIYRKRIAAVDRHLRPGDWVAVYAPVRPPISATDRGPAGVTSEWSESRGASPTEILIGYGIYNPKSEIAIRMIRWGPELPDELFWDRLLQSAVGLRRETLKLDTISNAYRLIHAEGDGLPGLVIDKYADVISAEVFSWGLWQRSRAICERLLPLVDARQYAIRTAPKLVSQEGFDAPFTTSSETFPTKIEVFEGGTRFRVGLNEGAHKTGFFCDQRENRLRLATLCAGQSVLDLCCYTGGFSLQAKCLGNATEVIGVDLDEAPLQLARENAKLNQACIRYVHADIFPYMRDCLRQDRQFDIVVLDPPKLIYSRAELSSGTRTHFDMNRLAMQLVRPGGLLLTCSCAGLLADADFLKLLRAAAREARPGDPDAIGRRLTILHRSGAGPDHPIAANCPETEYLKAYWLRLDDV